MKNNTSKKNENNSKSSKNNHSNSSKDMHTLSFSMWVRYSTVVVAPMHRISPVPPASVPSLH